MIERVRGDAPAGRNQSSAYRDLVWTVVTASDESLDLAGQTRQALEQLEKNLLELGSDKTRMLSAQVFVADIADSPYWTGCGMTGSVRIRHTGHSAPAWVSTSAATG